MQVRFIIFLSTWKYNSLGDPTRQHEVWRKILLNNTLSWYLQLWQEMPARIHPLLLSFETFTIKMKLLFSDILYYERIKSKRRCKRPIMPIYLLILGGGEGAKKGYCCNSPIKLYDILRVPWPADLLFIFIFFHSIKEPSLFMEGGGTEIAFPQKPCRLYS